MQPACLATDSSHNIGTALEETLPEDLCYSLVQCLYRYSCIVQDFHLYILPYPTISRRASSRRAGSCSSAAPRPRRGRVRRGEAFESMLRAARIASRRSPLCATAPVRGYAPGYAPRRVWRATATRATATRSQPGSTAGGRACGSSWRNMRSGKH